MRQVTIGVNEAGQRLDKFLNKYLAQAGKGFLYKMLRKKNITLNGKKADGAERLTQGDVVTFFLAEETLEKFRQPQEPPVAGNFLPVAGKFPAMAGKGLSVVYEDDDILLVNKPAGMLSQKAKAGDVSLCEHLVAYLLANGAVDEEGLRAFRPGVCNRLDRNTSGLVAAGKSLHGLQVMSALLRERRTEKYYLAIVHGALRCSGRQQAWLRKDEKTNRVQILASERPGAEWIETAYEPLAGTDAFSLVQVQLLTGRTHQIRAHLAALGHPLLGDRKYGGAAQTAGMAVGRQLLHSHRLCFPRELPELPALAGKAFCAPPPEDFERCRRLLGLGQGEKRS